MSDIPLSPIAEFLQREYCRFVLHVGNKEITSSGSAPITAMRIFEGSSCRVRDIFVSLNPMTTMFKSMAAAMLKAAVDVFHIRPNVPVHLTVKPNVGALPIQYRLLQRQYAIADSQDWRRGHDLPRVCRRMLYGRTADWLLSVEDLRNPIRGNPPALMITQAGNEVNIWHRSDDAGEWRVLFEADDDDAEGWREIIARAVSEPYTSGIIKDEADVTSSRHATWSFRRRWTPLPWGDHEARTAASDGEDVTATSDDEDPASTAIDEDPAAMADPARPPFHYPRFRTPMPPAFRFSPNPPRRRITKKSNPRFLPEYSGEHPAARTARRLGRARGDR